MRKDEKLISEAYLETLDEGIKDKLAALGLAGAMAAGGGKMMQNDVEAAAAGGKPAIVQQSAGTSISKLKNDLKKNADYFEGREEKVYPDPITGMKDPTIGVGFNLNHPQADSLLRQIGTNKQALLRGETLNDKQIDFLLGKTLDTAIQDIRSLVPSFDSLPYSAQLALADMSFNLGKPRLMKFEKMLAAVNKGDFNTAADEMVDSLWYKQTGRRAVDNVTLMKQAGRKGTKQSYRKPSESIRDIAGSIVKGATGIGKHIVQQGDNLTRIARQYGTSVKKLKQDNGLRSDLIRPGQELVIKR